MVVPAVTAVVALLGVPAALGATFTVTTTADDGAGSLRQAILDANGAPGPDTIDFAIPATGVQVIQPLTALPVVTDAVVIDGGTQVDASGYPLIRIDGGAEAAPSLYGLELNVAGVSSSTVNKLAFTRWDTGNGAGLYVHGAGTVLVTGNLFGTDAVGSAGLGNYSGVFVQNASQIGGAMAGQRNVVSGNVTGLAVTASATILGNYIGVTPSGTAARPNSIQGILVQGANPTIGGAAAGEGNVISANGSYGVRILAGTPGVTVKGNRIGTSPFGDDLGNGGTGVRIEGASGTLIGGTATVNDGNVIAFNNKGIVVTGGTGNAIRANDVFANDELGIDLGDDGPTVNDEPTAYDGDTGANQLQNFPLLKTAVLEPGLMVLTGELFSAQGRTFGIDVFTTATCDGSGFGEGAFYNGRFEVTTNADGFVGFTRGFGFGGAAGQAITATATDLESGDTSEFSACVISTGDGGEPPAADHTFVVTTASDTPVDEGCTTEDCTLREAIAAANESPNAEDPDRIEFAIAGFGVQTLTPATALPTITDPVVIDGTTQIGFDTHPVVFLDGSEASCGECGVDGLTVASAGGGTAIRGLAIGNFDGWGVVLSGGSGSAVEGSWVGIRPPLATTSAGNASGGIQILGSSGNRIGGPDPAQRVVVGSNANLGFAQIHITGLASGNVVQGSYVGLGPDGSYTYDTVAGIHITGGAFGNTIGGSNAAGEGNRITGFTGPGVAIEDAGSGNVVAGNAIGVDDVGEAPEIGIFVADTASSVIGDDVSPPGFANPDRGNVVVGSDTHGIQISGSATGTKVTGNFVGTDRTGAITTIGNATGIHVVAAANTIGPGNTIAYNTANGVEVDGELSSGNRIVANSIYGNGGLGIDLQSFSNNSLGAPVLTTAETTSAATSVEGTMSATDGTYFVELFTNAECDAVAGEGRTYVGFATAVVSGETGTFTATLPALPAGTPLTATATSAATNDTSEFTTCVSVTAATSATVVALEPVADTYVDGAAMSANFGSADHFDTYGGFNPSCVPHTAPAYGLLRFDLSELPGGTISDAKLVLTSRAGYAQDGDPSHHAIFLSDDKWSETSVTWTNRPADGTENVGVPLDAAGNDIRLSDRALGADFVWRSSCGVDFAGDQTKVFPTNAHTAKPLADARADMIGAVTSERDGDGLLSIELYNPNCAVCRAGANTAYWARYYSREAEDAALRPKLVVTYSSRLAVTSFAAAPTDPIAGVPEVRLADVPPSVLLAPPSATASTPLGDTPLGDTPLGDTPLGDTPLGDTPLGDTPLGDTSLGLADLLADLETVPLSSLPLLREGGWPLVLTGTPLASRALQNVSLGDVLALPPPSVVDGEGADDIRLDELDLSRSPLGDVATLAFALGNGVLLSQLSGLEPDDPLSGWCALTGTSCSTSSILALGLQGAPLGDTPLGDTPLGDTPLGDTPLGDTPLAGTPLGDTPLGDTPLGDTPLGDTPLGDTALADTPLGDTPLGDTNLSAAPLSDTPLGDTPLGDTPLGDTDLSRAPLGDTPLGDTPLGDTPLGDTPLGDTPLGDTPLGDTPFAALADCAAIFTGCPYPSTDLLKDHRGDLRPGLTISQLIAALTQDGVDSLTLGDVVASIPAEYAYTLSHLLATLEQPNGYTIAHVVAVITGASGLTLADLVASLPNAGAFTINDLLLAVLRATAEWERLDVTHPALADVAIGGGSVGLSANLTVSGAPTVLTFAVELPAGWTVPEASFPTIETIQIEGVGAASVLEVAAVTTLPDGRIRHTLETLDPVSGALRFTWDVRPGTTLGPASPSLAVSAAGGASAVAPAASVSVADTFEPNDGPVEAPAIVPERLYLSYLTSAGDVDYFRFTAPSVAGTRTTFRLSHLPADYDVVVYGPATDPLVEGGTAPPLETPVLGDRGAPITHLTEALPAETLDDLTLLSGRRVLGVSAFRSTEDEAVVVISDGTVGEYIVQVTGHNGASSVRPYVLRGETEPPRLAPTCAARFPGVSFGSAAGVAALPANVDTVFLANGPQLAAMGGQAVLDWFTDVHLAELAGTGHPSALVRLEDDPEVRAAYTAWNAQPCSTAAANAVVAAITDLLGELRQGRPLRNVVLLGADTAIPFARLDDLTTIANEADYASTFARSDDLYGALFEHKVLSDDPYATTDPIPYLQRQLFVPQLAVGRLVETPEQITGALDRFLAFDGVLDPASARTSGYDFLKDGAAGVAAAFADAVGAQEPTTSPPLIGDLWTRSTLAGALGTGTGLFGMNGHADHFRLQPARDANGDGVFADADLFSAADLPESLERAAVFSMGCHSGLSVSDVSVAANAADWAQAFAGRGTAAYVGNLGYGYGDTITVAYSESLNVRLAQALSDGLPVGQALVEAKQGHLADLGIVGVYDEKAMAELALYGLPMWSLGGGAASATTAAAATAAELPQGVTSLGTETDPVTGLDVDRYRSVPALTAIASAAGRYWEGPSGVQVTHLRPIQPKTRFDVAEDAHGVLITGITSHDVAGVDPVYARPIVDSSEAEPELPFADVAFPAKIQTLVAQRTLDGDRLSAVLVHGQFFSDATPDAAGAGVQRLFTSVDVDVLRSASTDRLAPRLDRIEATVLAAAESVAFTVEATDLPGDVAGDVRRVLVAFRETSSADWRFVDLVHGSGATWTGGAALPGATTATRVEYFVQAVDEAGNVAASTNKGFNYVGLPAPPAIGTGVVPSVVGPQSAGWYTDPPTFDVTAAAGIAVEVSIDGGSFAPHAGPISLAGDGVRIVRVRASNGYEATLAVPVDTEAPAIDVALPDAGGKYEQGALVPSFACRDEGIGVETCTIVADTVTVGAQTATVTAVDALGHTSTRTVAYTIENALPEAGPITVDKIVVPVGTTVTASAPFTDAGTADTHTAHWNFGDGTGTVTGSVVESGGSGTAHGSHTYTLPGVYTVRLVVRDQNGGASDEVLYSYVVVYDPSGAFVTGGGWITSPAGAYPADPSLTGKATFGFVSKYKKGQTVPEGNTEFHFRAADLLFRSMAYEWLVVAGARAQFKGTGSFNGQTGHGFLLSAVDGQVNGGGNVDKFRIKIWRIADGTVVYDNQLGAADDAEPTTALQGGSIVVHK